ncbi:hypothetical protein FACS1894159_01450 [Bacteroidia bacterium]|nr:hypothetical protein FACS1894159_01450 [Bacteroidia bacterium]
MLAACAKESSDWTEAAPLVPVSLAGIEAVNIDNQGASPVVSAEPIRKEAYMIGIKWTTDDSDPFGNQSISAAFGSSSGYTPGDVAKNFTKRIYTIEQFNAKNPAGANVSQYFKAIKYLPEQIDEGFVLLVAPDPGPHTFRVVYSFNSASFEYTTPTVELY